MSETTAQRNRRIKKILEGRWGVGAVSVRGGRGTAYGWVYIDIAKQPRDPDQLREWQADCSALFAHNNVEFGVHYPDDGFNSVSKNVRLQFERCRYARVFRGEYGLWGLPHGSYDYERIIEE